MTKYLEYGKCLETGETTKFFEYRMCLETGETTKSFEYRNNDFCDTQTYTQLLFYINHQHHYY